MKIRQWLGFNADASQYLLRAGELRVLNNLQSRRPGMLIARRGVTKIYGKYDDETIYGMYRRATLLGNPSDFLWLKKVLVPRILTEAQIAARVWPFEYVWMVMRVLGNESRVIDTQPLLPAGTTQMHNFSVAEDRHGRLFICYGHGARPKLYRPSTLDNVAIDLGLDPPSIAPSVLASGSGYFIEGVDVKFGGGSYYAPPTLSLAGGNPSRPAILKPIVQSGNVVGVDIVDGGAGYETPPSIAVSMDNIGTGFRAKGIISTSARTIEGFPESAAGSITGTAASATETYGANNSTADNSILYLSSPIAATAKVVSTDAAVITLNSIAGIQVGDTVTVYPATAPFNASAITVTAIDAANNTVTISDAGWVPASGVVYDMIFRRTQTVSKAKATYDSDKRRFYANVPLSSTSTSGRGAYATLEFSPKALGYGLDTSSLTSTSVNVTNRFRNYLYGEFWEGSDYNERNSVESIRYGGLQASGARYVRGFSGTVNGRSADVFWPDYSKISVWFCTGVYSSNLNQWTRADVTVTTENGAKVLVFQLRPTAAAKTIKSLGKAGVSTQLSPFDTTPDVQPPTVKLYLTDCPDSWKVADTQCLPTPKKEAASSFNRLAWWSDQTNVSRPIVGLSPPGTPVTASNVEIVDPGRGWQQNTLFAFRIYQANPYSQVTDYNTAAKKQSIRRGHPVYDQNNYYCEFRLRANSPDNQTPHGPPAQLLTRQISIPGEGYTSGTAGTITLYKRALTAAETAAVPAQTISWSAQVLDTLSSSTTGQIASIQILSKGQNYFAEPTIEVRGGGTGYGLSVKPTVSNGRIDSVQILDPGQSYTTQPELYTSARAAELTPVMRPAMRGKYRCAYRFVDLSETELKTVTATLGESATTLTLSDATGVEADMILEAPQLPHYCKIKSVNGTQVEVNQTITQLSEGQSISVLVRDMSKPIGYSDFSPLTDVDAGPNEARTHSSIMQWALPGVRPPERADKIELWRTSGDQSLVFYRCEAYGIPTESGVTIVGTDTLTDEELFNPERPHYAAMPVVLPNGGVNAYRFGKPRSDMSVCVAFQDRLWMGVSTSGEGVNTLYFSGFDDFEAFPDVNELPIQTNQKNADTLTALAPFGSMLLAMQNTRTYAVTYNTDPTVDGAIQMLSHRGCLHQRCWDIHENVLYAADESGIYALERSGEIAPISLPIRDYFVSELIDFSKRETFFLQTDPRTHILRFFCVLKTNPTDTPSFALCFDIQAKQWWSESYPNSFTSACTGRPGSARVTTILMGAVDGNVYEIDSDSDHANESITDTFVTEGGSGYREAPTITVPNCKGAVVQGVVSEGRLVDVIIQDPGWSAKYGIGLLAENGTPLTAHDGKPLQGVEYDSIKLDIGPPEEGGIQAVAYANFAVTPRVARTATITTNVLGESVLRLDPPRTTQVAREFNQPIASESGKTLLTQNDKLLTTEPPPVEIGMEAIGDFIPLNSFVARIDGRDIHLVDSDGKPIVYLSAEPLTVTFYKPFRTHIPFRMATGFMQLVNDDLIRNGDKLIDRSVSVIYTPTAGDKEVELIERFNGWDEMTPNLMRRGRQGASGFTHRQDSASTVLNTSRRASHLGFATGVAKAKFASAANADMAGTDQHLQVELYSRPAQASPWKRTNFWIGDSAIPAPQPFVLHGMTVEGVIEDAN